MLHQRKLTQGIEPKAPSALSVCSCDEALVSISPHTAVLLILLEWPLNCSSHCLSASGTSWVLLSVYCSGISAASFVIDISHLHSEQV